MYKNGEPVMEDQTPRELSKQQRAVILAVVFVLIAAVLIVKYSLPDTLRSGLPAQEQLESHLAQGMPVMVFFYSDDCRSCREMKTIIDEIYPSFRETVALLEVNVYDDENKALLERTGVHIAPAELFIAADGTQTLVLDVMEAAALQAQLQAISGGTP